MNLFIALCAGVCITGITMWLSEFIGYIVILNMMVITFLVYNRLAKKEEHEKIIKELDEIKIHLSEIEKR